MIHLLPYSLADGSHNMAADEVLLQGAAAGRASLRFYGWSEATLSLGYFQPSRARFEVAAGRVPDAWVRRPTGGNAGASSRAHLRSRHSLGRRRAPQSWMRRMHGIIAAALPELADQIATFKAGGKRQTTDPQALCFRQPTAGDLLCGPHKILGSSQRKHHRCLLQHGALLLAQSPFTPTLPGLKELTGYEAPLDTLVDAIVQRFQMTTGEEVVTGDWTAEESAEIARLVTKNTASGGGMKSAEGGPFGFVCSLPRRATP